MKKTTTSSYVLTLKLNTDASDEAFLNKRFFLSCQIYNRLVSHVRKQLSKMLSDYRYRQLLKQWYKTRNGNDAQTKHLHSLIGKQLGQIRLEYGLSEYQLHEYVKTQQHIYSSYLGSQSCQRIASAVWKSVESYLFKNGKYIRFHKSMDYSILYGAKTNATYMVFHEQRKIVRIGKNYEIRGNHDKWVLSKSYKKLRNQKRMLEKKQAVALKQSHEIMANDIIAMGNDVYVETMNFKSLQKRKKKTTRSKTGKFHRKGRFGRSIKSHAPAMLVSIINRKLSYQCLEIHKINTQTFRASQYNHITDEYVKKKLGNRSILIHDIKMQRDLYSAFLLMNSASDLLQTDRNRCMETFDRFVTLHNLYMENLVAQYRNGIRFPSCMGIVDFVA